MSLPSIFNYLHDEEVQALFKLAEEKKPKSALRALGEAALGAGVGTAGGVLAGHLGNKLYKRLTGTEIPSPALLSALPVIGGAMGVAYNLARARQLEEMRHELQTPHDPAGGRVP